jgi:ABC-2 type transport system ATP-binding protein
VSSTIAARDTAISTRRLAKSYGPVKAVVDVNLDVRRGEIYGFLGRNGAGKTTTIRMLLGLVRPSAGEIRMLGSSLEEDRAGVLSRIGFFVESAAAYPNLTTRENLRIQQRLTGAPSRAVDDVIELLRLGEYCNRQAGRLSLGNRQRLSLARALVHSPELLILDEPANGLDPAGIVEIRALLRRLADERGVTVFMSSHLLDEVEHLADRVGIVHQGSLVEEVDYGDLQENGRLAIEIEVDDVAHAEKVLRDELGLVELSRSGDASLRISDRSAKPALIARALVGAGISLQRLVPMEEDLERHFMRLTGGAS